MGHCIVRCMVLPERELSERELWQLFFTAMNNPFNSRYIKSDRYNLKNNRKE